MKVRNIWKAKKEKAKRNRYSRLCLLYRREVISDGKVQRDKLRESETRRDSSSWDSDGYINVGNPS